MTARYQSLLFTPSVLRAQEQAGSRSAYENFLAKRPEDAERADVLGPQEANFIAARDSFYMGSVSEDGWPYIQHRGGAPGFVRVLDEKTIGFADFRGNRQYISVGNLAVDDRVSLFLMDYPNRARLKLIGRARVVETGNETDLLARLTDPAYPGKVERGIVIEVEAFDWNCSQHILPRFTTAQLRPEIDRLAGRIRELEAELAKRSGAEAPPG